MQDSQLKPTSCALQILKDTCNFIQIGLPPLLSVQMVKKQIFDAAQKTPRWSEVSGEPQSNNVKNGKVKTRFFQQPPPSAVNTPTSKNLGRAITEFLLHLFQSHTFSGSLIHPLHRNVSGAETAGVMHEHRTRDGSNNPDYGFPTERLQEPPPSPVTGDH